LENVRARMSAGILSVVRRAGHGGDLVAAGERLGSDAFEVLPGLRRALPGTTEGASTRK
jgi:hypothetical protein